MKYSYVIFLILLFAGCCCNDDPVGPDPAYQISVLDVGVTEVWLKISVNAERGFFSLRRNDSTILANLSSPIDTVLYDDSLLPKHTYTYKLDRGSPLTLTTLDTTSHNFTWEVTTLGDGNYSVLYDVAIVNDTCVYAVGEIYKRDSTGQFETTPYNVARWNNNSWQIMRVPTKNYGGYISNSPVKTVCTFGENNIWTFSVPGSYTYWNGVEWRTEYVPERSGGGTKLWGTNSNNLYLVGTNGSISYYNGTAWQKLESGTTTHINDAWGVKNVITNQEEVYCPVTSFFQDIDRKILKIHNTTQVDSFDWSPKERIYSVWSPNGLKFYAGGDGLFCYNEGRWAEVNLGVDMSVSKIRGNALNDIIVVGSNGLLTHYNGMTWQIINLPGNYLSVDFKNNVIVAVGWSSSIAITAVGKRN